MERIKSFFYFTKSERHGILALIFFIILSMTAPEVTRIIIARESGLSEDFSPEVMSFINQINDTVMQNDGFQAESAKQQAGSSGIVFQNEKKNINSKQLVIIDINSADSLSLLKLDGIGPAFAHRILKYRERLGGFVSVNQLLEVYGFKPLTLESIRKSLRVENTGIRKISINSASFKEIMRHPYSSYELAKAICNFRSSYGKIEKADEIRKAGIMPDSTYFKLLPYMSVE